MTKTLEQLRDEARSLGLRVHHKHAEGTLRDMIEQARQEMQKTVESREIVCDAERPSENHGNYVETEKSVRSLMQNHKGEKLWVMHDKVTAYEADGWFLIPTKIKVGVWDDAD